MRETHTHTSKKPKKRTKNNYWKKPIETKNKK